MNHLLFLNLGTPELILVVLALAYPVLFIICLIDILRSEFKDSTTKLLWAMVVIFVPYIGSIIYLAIGRSSKVLSS
jgi:hypothetical protein